MLPTGLNGVDRQNIPLWAFIAAGVGVVVLLFLTWVMVGMYSQPTPEATTLDVPLAR